MAQYFYDENRIRYNLVSTRPGKNLNWLFIPGGPGADSRYLLSLLDILEIPGNQWLIDLPGNGDHATDANYDFDRWLDIFLPMIGRFQNVVVVGHSFGAQIPLLFPQLEGQLSGLVALNSSPSLWLQEAAKLAVQAKLPDLTQEMHEFTNNPNPETFKKALAACMPYYFPESSMEVGKALLMNLPFEYTAAGWWQDKAIGLPYSAQWIPQQVPMLIVGAEYDYITPFSLYENDKRFSRSNIKQTKVMGAGHMPWIEKPDTIRFLFEEFTRLVEPKA